MCYVCGMPPAKAGLFGSLIRDDVLKLIVGLDRGGYAREIAQLLDRDLITVQRNLQALERDGILASRMIDRVRLFEINRRYRYAEPLTSLLQAMLYDDVRIRGILETMRQRPRRTGKAL
jgi:predicted transcriptional regulator